jgi:hypothetical protein
VDNQREPHQLLVLELQQHLDKMVVMMAEKKPQEGFTTKRLATSKKEKRERRETR